MTEKVSAAGHEAFQKSMLECIEDISELLGGLRRRYEMTVIIGAMAEHVGAALQVLMRKNVCDVRQVGQVIKQIETSAFLPKTAAELKSEESAEPSHPLDPENLTRH
jgi:hypothetical protein